VAGALDGAALSGIEIRHPEPSDHARVIAVLDEWWGGRSMVDMLPRLFFVHFRDTSFVVQRGDELAGFLVGFLSPSEPEEAYVHFVGVSPSERGSGLGRELYERFFALARERGRSRVTCVTSPVNTVSLAFHESIGFRASAPQPGYDGPEKDRVVLTKSL
jgi:predicted GNAT superfamily acetyltransferase